MNIESECNCCPTETCEACLSQLSCRPHVRSRIERPLKNEADCSFKNCNIFGSHDAAPLPEYHRPEKLLKTKNENKNSLGSPIGLVTSNVNFKTEGKTGDVMQARYATYLKAFARLHLNDEKEWDAQILDDIMKEGLDLYTNSRQSPVETVATDIYMSHELGVLREFELSGFTFQIELMPKFQLSVDNSTELGAKGDGVELTLDDIMPAMRSFLRQHKYGLLKVGTFYTMIWRSRGAYFVFDACGRRLTDFQADKDNGVVMLMCFKSLENIRHLINKLSGLQQTEPVVIRELKLVKVVTPHGSIMQLDYGLRKQQYEIVNDDYAYLRSDLHLTLNKEDVLRSRCSLPVAVTAIVVSKIDHPATWDLKMVDKIICFGANFCQALWAQCKSAEATDVNDFPTTFILGQFHINIEVKNNINQGIWHCVPAFEHSELANALRKAFDAKLHKLILQINYQMYAILKKQEFIYLLDPYRHRIMGKQNESKIYEEMEKSASVRMFRTFEVFMNVLNNILLDSNRTSHFCLHFIKVKNIQTLHEGKPGQARQIKEPQRDEDGEILSLNERICFEEAEDLCKAGLGEISDYEDDDLKSDMVEIELRTSSSEEELLEEEAVAGDVEEMEDIESSSSGEEATGHKKNAPLNKSRGKHNTVKRKERNKGGQNNKKGKGVNDNEQESDDSDIIKSNTGKKGNKSKKPKKEMKGAKTNRNVKSDDETGLRQNPEAGSGNTDKPSNMDGNMSKDKEFNQDTVVNKDKTLSRDIDISKDNDLSKTLVQQKDDVSKDKDEVNQDLNKSDCNGFKSDIGKNKNKENEILKSFHKFVDDKDLTENKDETKEVQKVKSVDRFNKARTEKLNDNSQKDRDKKCNDRTEADDKSDDCLKRCTDFCSTPNPNRYPGYLKYPVDLAVLGSESGSYESICKLFQAGFKVADRLLLMTLWGNFVIFRCPGDTDTKKKHYYLFDGCACNYNRFRHFDLNEGTAGLICFEHLHNIIEYIRHLRQSRSTKRPQHSNYSADDICKEYANKSFILRV